MNELWVVLYNWMNDEYHTEPMDGWILKNVEALMTAHQWMNNKWTVIGAVPRDKRFDVIRDFRHRIEEKRNCYAAPNSAINTTST